MRLYVCICAVLFALTGCVLSDASPTRFSISYPGTEFTGQPATRIIPEDSSGFQVVVNFAEPITGFEVADFELIGGHISEVKSNSERTVWTINIDVDLAEQPREVSLKFIGTVDGAFGMTWTPDISATFTYESDPTTVSAEYPDTIDDGATSAQIISVGDSSFRVQIGFHERISEFDASDLAITGGRISNITSNDDGTVWTLDVDVDLSAQPGGEISLEIIGTVVGDSGLPWTPDFSATFMYPKADFEFSERQNQSENDWGISRASSNSETAVAFATNYANSLANGILGATLDIDPQELELVANDSANGITRRRGTLQIGGETYSAEVLLTASGSLGLHIFDPTDVIFTRGATYMGDLVGSHRYQGALSATNFGEAGDVFASLQGDFSLIADFGGGVFTISSGTVSGDDISIDGTGVLDTSTGELASDNLEIIFADPSLEPVNLISFGNIHGDGSDVTGLFYSNEVFTEDENGLVPSYVGTFVGSR